MSKMTQLKIELEQEEDGRWIGEMPTLPGVMAYGHCCTHRRPSFGPSCHGRSS